MKVARVAQIMKRPVWSCRPEDSLNCAAEIMWNNDCGCVPVTDKDGRLVGMITDRDICMAAYLQGEALRALPVYSAMAKDVFSCHPEDTIAHAEAVMRVRQVRRIPVINDAGYLVGLLSLSDIAREAGLQSASNAAEATLAKVGETFVELSKRHACHSLAIALKRRAQS